jgi:hypothetical protein
MTIIPLAPSVAAGIKSLAQAHGKSEAVMANEILHQTLNPSAPPLEQWETDGLAKIPISDDAVWGRVEQGDLFSGEEI